MYITCNRAFKEWDTACRAMMEGRQAVMIRKGGIREQGGRFVIEDREFWLMPTFDHQNVEMLQPGIHLTAAAAAILPPVLGDRGGATTATDAVSIQAYCVIERIWEVNEEERVNALRDEMIWNEKYVRLRFDYSPYDPLYVLLVRVYRMPEPIMLPVIKAYGGCKSWVTLERSLSTAGCVPAVSDEDFMLRGEHVRRTLANSE